MIKVKVNPLYAGDIYNILNNYSFNYEVVNEEGTFKTDEEALRLLKSYFPAAVFQVVKE